MLEQRRAPSKMIAVHVADEATKNVSLSFCSQKWQRRLLRTRRSRINIGAAEIDEVGFSVWRAKINAIALTNIEEKRLKFVRVRLQHRCGDWCACHAQREVACSAEREASNEMLSGDGAKDINDA